MKIRKMLRKYFVMGSQNCHNQPEQILQQAIDGGITAFQFREKGHGSLNGQAKIELGKRLRAICFEHQIPFIINDDIELVDILDVDGVHVGQDDIHVEKLRNMFPNLIIGLSISNEQELNNSNLNVIDYVGAGPVYTTSTKDDAKKSVGTEWITTLRNKHKQLPIVGIGGINVTNAQNVLEAGADGVAFISAVTYADHVKKAVQLL